MIDLEILLAESDPENWIEALPAYQRNSIHLMREKGGSYEYIASVWIAAGTSNTAPFSSGEVPKPDTKFSERLLKELRAYLCGEKRYEKDRKKMLASGKEVHVFVVSSISVAIAPHIGSAGAVIAPIVALALANIGKVSLNAWCGSSNQP